MTAGARWRELLAGPPFIAADCYSALTARIVQDVGFPAAYMGGHSTSMMHYAIPDYGVFTSTEMIEIAGRVAGVDIHWSSTPTKPASQLPRCIVRSGAGAPVSPACTSRTRSIRSTRCGTGLLPVTDLRSRSRQP
jgi:hypothetical protein